MTASRFSREDENDGTFPAGQLKILKEKRGNKGESVQIMQTAQVSTFHARSQRVT
jgi:hypothetical protein